MSAVVFDGLKKAREIEKELAVRVAKLDRIVRMASVVFEEDEASLLYTRLKKEAAVRVGLQFSESLVSMQSSLEHVREAVRMFCEREDVAGVLIQKPSKRVFERLRIRNKDLSIIHFRDWWKRVVQGLDPLKDVDCLTEVNLQRVYTGEWEVLPATVRAVVETLKMALADERTSEANRSGLDLRGVKCVVVGRSDITGRPLAAVLEQSGGEVSLFGVDLDVEVLRQAEVVVSATGCPGLIEADMVKEGAVVVDVGSPKGDVVFEGVKERVRFVTPVPDGVGPMTVACLLTNLVERVEGMG